jgi:hypothetical protein
LRAFDRTIVHVTAGVIAATSLVLLGSAVWATPATTSPVVAKSLGWVLTQSRVVSPGKTVASREGDLTVGYSIEATATATAADAPVQRGILRMTVTAFCPAEDMPGQKAGRWYVRGMWSIADPKIALQTTKMRHSASVIKGDMQAELSFNPAVEKGNVEATVRLPMSPTCGRWARGTAIFTGNEKFEGKIEGTLKRWPELQLKEGQR